MPEVILSNYYTDGVEFTGTLLFVKKKNSVNRFDLFWLSESVLMFLGCFNGPRVYRMTMR